MEFQAPVEILVLSRESRWKKKETLIQLDEGETVLVLSLPDSSM